MGALARAWLTRAATLRLPTGTVLTFWLAVALGILVKGPMAASRAWRRGRKASAAQ
jgi:hypothetical protein